MSDWHSLTKVMWQDVESELERVNAFGRIPLHYRVATYGGSLRRMVERLPVYRVEGRGGLEGITRPLREIELAGGPSWILGLVESWALVAQVLGFYQERMANEGFLASATQELSVRELLRMVGYRSFPGTAGSALSAFLTSGAKGMPEIVDIPKGARIQGVPLGGQLPQIFETTASIGGRAEWNRMPAHVPRIRVSPPLEGTARAVDLAGYETSLKPGDPLLLQLDPLGGVGAGGGVGVGGVGEGTLLRWVEKAKRKKGKALRLAPEKEGVPARVSLRGFDTPATEVTLTEALDPQASGELKLEAAYRFADRAHLFGHNAPVWSQVPDTIRRHYAPIQGGVQVSSDDGSTWQPADEGLPELEIHSLAAIGPRLFAGTTKGLFRRSDEDFAAESSSPNGSSQDGGSGADGDAASGSTGWQPITNGIGRLTITTVAGLPGESSGDHVWVADNRGQVYQSSDGGGSFAPIQGRATPQVAGLGALLKRAFGKLTAPLHLEKEPPARPNLPSGPVYSLAVLARGDQLRLFAGTDKGVFTFLLPAGGWRPASQGLPGYDAKTGQAATSVRALLAPPSGQAAGRLLLGCSGGIFCSHDGRSWREASRGLAKKTSVLCLTGYGDGRRRRFTYFAGTESGVYRSDDPERGWSSASLGLLDPAPDASGPPRVEALTSRLDPVQLQHHVFAGTPAGLFRSTERGESWGPVLSLESTSKIDAVVVDRVGRVLAAMPFAGFASDEWPGFHLEAGVIDLDRVYTHVVSGSWVVLQQPESVGGISTRFFEVRGVSQVERADFELDALVTRLEVDADGTLPTFDLRSTQVYLSSVELEPWRRELPDIRPVRGAELRVAQDLKQLPQAQRRMIVTGRRARVRPRRGDWRAPGTGTPPPPDASQSLPALAFSRLGEEHLVRVIDRAGRERELLADALEWMPAEDDDETIGQAVHVVRGFKPAPTARSPSLSPSPKAQATSGSGDSGESKKGEAEDDEAEEKGAAEGESFTTLLLDQPLDVLLDPTTVLVWGNVAPSSQGETLTMTIGSGDASKALQRFAIDRPITYLPAPTEDGFRSTLEIEVAGAKWREVPHLADVDDGGAHVYMVRPDLAGNSLVIFGDGTNGARLPTGQGNVVATFRSGMWPQKLAPHQLSILQTRPLGLRFADNPLATEPGAPAEDKGASRRRVSSWLRPLGRVVSLRDYQDFVSQNTAVALALVAPLVFRGRPLIQITIAGQDGERIDEGSEIYRQIIASLEVQRSPGPPIRVQNYQPVQWLIALRLRLERQEDRSQVADAVRAQMNERFSFANAQFGESLYVGQMVDTALEVDGVLAAEVTRFGSVAVGWPKSGGAASASPTDSSASSQTASSETAPDGAAVRGFRPAAAGRLQAKLAHAMPRAGHIRPAQLLRLAKVVLEFEK